MRIFKLEYIFDLTKNRASFLVMTHGFTVFYLISFYLLENYTKFMHNYLFLMVCFCLFVIMLYSFVAGSIEKNKWEKSLISQCLVKESQVGNYTYKQKYTNFNNPDNAQKLGIRWKSTRMIGIFSTINLSLIVAHNFWFEGMMPK